MAASLRAASVAMVGAVSTSSPGRVAVQAAVLLPMVANAFSIHASRAVSTSLMVVQRRRIHVETHPVAAAAAAAADTEHDGSDSVANVPMPAPPIKPQRVHAATAAAKADEKPGVAHGAGMMDMSDTAMRKPWVMWVQRAGDLETAKVSTTAADVGDLKKDVSAALKLDMPLNRITLKVVGRDGGTSAALDGMDTVSEALGKAAKALGLELRRDRIRIVAQVVGSTPGAAAAALRTQAERLRHMRKALQRAAPLERLASLELTSPGLKALSAAPSLASDASAAPETRSRTVSLAAFSVPGVPNDVLLGPKGFEALLGKGGSFLVEHGRLALAQEFLNAMLDPDVRNFGVLLSGPNGVGKSAVGVLSYLCCAAQGLPVVYIPRAGDWVTAETDGCGNAFFVRVLLEQNADVVEADRDLMQVFGPLFDRADERGESLFNAGASIVTEADTAMKNLVSLLRRRKSSLRIGVIVDETQRITEASVHNGSRYFRQGWYGWQSSPGNEFVRMDIASSHGLREFTLASGEDDRLRFVRPWDRDTAMAFLGDKASPGYIAEAAARERVYYVCGGVVRSLLEAKAALGMYGGSPAGLDNMEADIRARMLRGCDTWMAEAGSIVSERCAASITNFMHGSTPWQDLKPAYDQGLVALAPKSRHAVPVSSVAASVLHQALARLVKRDVVPLESLRDGAERGRALEQQLHAVLDPCSTPPIPTHTLDGSAASIAVIIRVDYALPFLVVTETQSAATAYVLYLPKSCTYPCDAVIVPPANSPTAPVLLLECSVTSPTDSARLDKLLGWFRSDLSRPADRPAEAPVPAASKGAPEEFCGFIDAVKAAHPGRPVVVLLFWPGSFRASAAVSTDTGDGSDADSSAAGGSTARSTGSKRSVANTKATTVSKATNKQRVVDVAQAAGVELCVLDAAALEKLGVRVKS